MIQLAFGADEPVRGGDDTAGVAMAATVASGTAPRQMSALARLGVVVALAGLGAAVAAGGISLLRNGTTPADLSSGGVWSSWAGVVLNPWYFGFLMVLVAVQALFPGRGDLPLLSAGMAGDALWFVTGPLLASTVVAAFTTTLGAGIDSVIGPSQFSLVAYVGVGGTATLAFVVGDLAAWWSHWLHHRFAVLWQFHAVHHSQRSMNVLSDNREHIVETVVNATLVFIPARLFGLDSAAAGTLAFLGIYVGAFIHANIRTNLGPLGRVIVSPQFHRVHHSRFTRHYNTNYGVVFAFWDSIFETLCRGAAGAEYPATGIADTAFPLETSAPPWRLVSTWFRQMAYPFRAIARDASMHHRALSGRIQPEVTASTPVTNRAAVIR